MVKVQRLFAKTNLKVPVCRTYRTITQKCLQLELPTENSVYSQENRNRAGNYAHLTSENGKLAAFASGRPAFQLIHGEKAHSRYFSETAYGKLTGDNKELLIIPGASHTDLYDQMDVIPFEKLKAFFEEYLK